MLKNLTEINKPPKEIREKDVKERVKKIVTFLVPDAYIFMPVQSGFGQSTLDFLIGINGFLLAVETKISGKRPTVRQTKILGEITKSKSFGLIIDELNLEDLVCVVVALREDGFSPYDLIKDSLTRYLERSKNYKS